MTLDLFADVEVQRDEERNPIIDGKTYYQASKLGDLIEDKFGLNIWKTKHAMAGVAANDELRTEVALLDPGTKDGWGFGRNSLIEKAVSSAPRKTKGGTAAALGTKIHAAIDKANKGLEFDSQFTSDVTTYRRMLDKAGIVVVSSEQFVVCDELGVAGTYDGVYEVTLPIEFPGGTLEPGRYIGDAKTGKEVKRNGLSISMQLAVYANGDILDADGNRVALDVRRDYGLVAHMPAGAETATLLVVDLTQGYEFARLAVAVDRARKAKGLMAEVLKISAPTLAERVQSVVNYRELEELYAQYRDEWTDEIRAIARKRAGEVNGMEQARRLPSA